MTESQTPAPSGPEQETEGNPIKEMFLLAALYLPLGFFLWFYLAGALMRLPGRLAEWAMTGFFPEVFERVVQLGFHFEIQTLIRLERQVEGQTALLNGEINPMIYAWGMALLFGLIMATPLTVRRRIVQMLISYLVVSVVTAWGVFWETWTDLAFRYGPESAAAVAQFGPPTTMIALFYQLGYLMLPAVVPLATWILMNRPFLEQVVFTRRR
ncbi:MAG: exosortase H-associated membrane protein [Wenzhouxiangellaceae bacterium]